MRARMGGQIIAHGLGALGAALGTLFEQHVDGDQKQQ